MINSAAINLDVGSGAETSFKVRVHILMYLVIVYFDLYLTL